jgi:hypothetical protein
VYQDASGAGAGVCVAADQIYNGLFLRRFGFHNRLHNFFLTLVPSSKVEDPFIHSAPLTTRLRLRCPSPGFESSFHHALYTVYEDGSSYGVAPELRSKVK